MLKRTRAEVCFDIIQEIGKEGKNSETSLVFDVHLKAQLVIKAIPKVRLANAANYFDEASILYLSSHSNVVPIHYASEDNDNIYIAMPHYPKGSLKARLNTEFLTVREIIRYASHFLSGLHNIHSKRLIHFDIKPDNILLSERDEAMLADFGLAKHTSYSGTAGQDRIYHKMIPPEAFQGDQFSRAFDIYQAGLTLYRMANGEDRFYQQYNNYIMPATLLTPSGFDRHQFKFDVMNERFPVRRDYLEHIPTKLKNVITKCLMSDPYRRYQSALDIVNELATIDGLDLDWRYQENSVSGKQWVMDKDNTVYRLMVDTTGAAVADKKSGNGAYRRILSHCKPSLSEKDIKDFLKSP